jgi:hypothetical protein
MAKDIGGRFYELKSSRIEAIVAKTTVAVIKVSALATIKEAIARGISIFIGYQTSVPNLGYKGISYQFIPPTSSPLLL